jgi:hypothetical protein
MKLVAVFWGLLMVVAISFFIFWTDIKLLHYHNDILLDYNLFPYLLKTAF